MAFLKLFHNNIYLDQYCIFLPIINLITIHQIAVLYNYIFIISLYYFLFAVYFLYATDHFIRIKDILTLLNKINFTSHSRNPIPIYIFTNCC